MPLLDIQRKGRELGRIRLGQQVEYVKDGKTKRRPTKLSTFRFTTNSRMAADAVASLLGGEVTAWEGGSQAWQVTTDATEIPVMVPPGDGVISQDYELWSGGGCQRRCDGITARLFGEGGEQESRCVCPPAGVERADAAAKGNACKPTTRLNVMLPDLPDIGVWRVESHGFYAAVELGGAAELLSAARDKGVILAATLRLDPRRSAVPGRPVREWYVPVLDIAASLRQLVTGQIPGTLAQQLPPAPVRAITAGASTPPAPGAGSPPPATGDGAAPALPPVGAGAALPGTAEQDLAPDGPQMTAQQIADKARGARSKPVLDALGKTAADLDLLDDMVDDGTGVLGALSEVLHTRLDEIRASA
jgi:hypothetical protein